jgi:hypothetical protein
MTDHQVRFSWATFFVESPKDRVVFGRVTKGNNGLKEGPLHAL